MCSDLNREFVFSPPGILKILEMIFGLLCWALTAETSNNDGGPHVFVMVVAVSAWILTVILFIVYLFRLHSKHCSNFPWSATEFFFNIFWALAYFTAAIVSAVFASGNGQLVAATFFAFLSAVLYCIHFVIAFVKWRGSLPWQSGPPSVTVNT